jgi:hypothetical protein
MNHKRKRSKNQRSGCLMCKFWKINGYSTEKPGGERFSDHKRREFAKRDAKDAER